MNRRIVMLVAIAAVAAAHVSAAQDPAPPAAPLQLKPVATAEPQIPDEICQRRLTGWVDLDFAVLPDGSVADVTVTGAEPKQAFEQAAAGAVAKWKYPPQSAPVKMRLRLPMTYADCRAEQRRIVVPASLDGVNQSDCAEISAGAKQLGERFEKQDAGRAVLQGEGAQVYLAPRPHCFALGKKLKGGTRLTAWLEYEAFTLVSPAGFGEGAAVWVWSNQLKDTATR